MAWYSGLEHIIRRNEPLARWTTFRIGGEAGYFLLPEDEETFAAAYAAALRAGLPVRLMGGGSNLLAPDDGVDGAVICTARLRGRPVQTNGRTFRVPAGVTLSRLLRWCARMGMSGLENLAGIPGTVGGAVVMNAGALGVTMGDAVKSVWCADRKGRVFRRSGDEITWGYRSTDIRSPVLAVELRFRPDDPESVRIRMSEAHSIRRSTQPVHVRSAGCFFKNPAHAAAGRLIEEAGLKGTGVGDARVSRKHANFIVNTGRATARDVLLLCKRIKRCVKERFGVALEREVCCWS